MNDLKINKLFYKNWGIMIECGKIKVSWCFFFVDFCVPPPPLQPCCILCIDYSLSVCVGTITGYRVIMNYFTFGLNKILFIRHNHKLNKQVQETQKQYAYLSVTYI